MSQKTAQQLPWEGSPGTAEGQGRMGTSAAHLMGMKPGEPLVKCQNHLIPPRCIQPSVLVKEETQSQFWLQSAAGNATHHEKAARDLAPCTAGLIPRAAVQECGKAVPGRS